MTTFNTLKIGHKTDQNTTLYKYNSDCQTHGAEYGEAFLRPIKAGSNDVVGVPRRVWPFGLASA